MSTLLRILICILLGLGVAQAQTPTWQWATQCSGTILPRSQHQARNGNLYTTGVFTDTVYFGRDTLISNGEFDLFILKCSSSGDIIWAKSYGGSTRDEIYCSVLDNHGNLFLTVHSDGFFRLGTYTVSNDFIAELNLSTLEWSEPLEIAATTPIKIALDTTGHLYVTGQFSYTVTIGNAQLTGGIGDLFVGKINWSTRTCDWAKSCNGPHREQGDQILLDGDGDVIVIGEAGDSAVFGPVTFLDSDGGYGYLMTAKLSGVTGNVQWAKRIKSDNGIGGVYFKTGCTDASGNLYITGDFLGGIVADEDTIHSSLTSYNDIFVLKQNLNSGDFLWIKQFGNIGNQQGRQLLCDGHGDVLLVGVFDGPSIQIGSDTLFNAESTNSGYDVFITKLGPQTGNPINSLKWGGLGHDGVGDITIDSAGSLFIPGYASADTLRLGQLTLVNNPSYLAKLYGFASPGNITATQPIGNGSFHIYPNPATSMLHITGHTNSFTAQLIDPMGRLVRTISLDKSTAKSTVSVSRLPPGLYTLRCGSQSQKVVIE